MEGQLSEHPLAELIREISDKRLSGRLRAQQERVTVVVYFKSGSLNYAASNARMLRLREHLLKQQIVSEEVMGRFDAKASDISLAKQLTAEGLVSERQAALLQFQQVTDVLRLALLWIEGRWEFDSRSQLSEEVPFELEVEPLLLDACRRIPLQFVASRFTNNAEIVSPVVNPPQRNDLQPTEVFLLSRLDGPMSISDLGALSGLPEAETLRLIYALSLTGLIQRQHLRKAFRGDAQPAPPPLVAETPKPAADVHAQTNETEALLKFLDRIDRSSTHYEVLDVGPTATGADIKKSYYEIARRYHPDRFRKDSDPDLNFRIESAFARVTQAYDTLRDAGLRATYDSKLDAQARARTMVETPAASPSAPPPPTGQPAASSTNKSSNAPLTDADRAAAHFQEALAAKQLGKSNSAIGLFSAAARLVPNDPRYRAYYGQALASHPGTRRLAEAEIQAAVKIDPENADYRVMLAELYRDLGFNVRARSELERILKSAPNHQRARELLRAL